MRHLVCHSGGITHKILLLIKDAYDVAIFVFGNSQSLMNGKIRQRKMSTKGALYPFHKTLERVVVGGSVGSGVGF